MVFNILKSKKAEGSVSTAIKVVISVVLGGLILLGTIGLIDTTVGPALNDTLNTQQGEEISNPINLSNPSVSEIKPGDVNFDGFINENDVEYLTRYLNGWEGYGWENSHLVTDYMSKVDLDSNDIIDTEDLELLKEMIIANSIHHSGFIPKGAKYTVRSTGKVLEEGDLFPETIEDLDNSIAYTDNRKIFINLNNTIIKDVKDLEERYLCYLGFLGHELGHVIHTDFEINSIWIENLKNGKIYGSYDSKYQKEADLLIKYAANPSAFKFIAEIFCFLTNQIEDRYVNDKICEEFPGSFRKGLKTCHKHQFKNDFELCDSDISNLINANLCICLFDKIPDVALSKYPKLKDIKKVETDIPKKEYPIDRLSMANDVLLIMWEEIQEMIDISESLKDALKNLSQTGGDSSEQQDGSEGQNSSQQGNSNDSNAKQALQKAINQMIKGSQEGSGVGVKAQAQKEESGDNNSNERSKTSNNSNESDKTEEQSDGSQNDSGVSNSKDGDDESEEQKGSGGNTEDSLSEDNASKEENSDAASGEKGKSKEKNEDSSLESSNSNNESNNKDNSRSAESQISESSDSSDSPNNSDSNSEPTGFSNSSEENPQRAIDALLSEYLKDMARRNPEMIEREMALHNLAELTKSSSSAHRGYPVKLHTIKPSLGQRSKYDMIAHNLLPISRRLQRKLSEVLDEQAEGGVYKNLLKGNKINPAAAASNNGRIFKRNQLPESKDIAISVLVDQSGSMSGTRIAKALEMSLIIEDFCRGLDIPLSITGHRDSGGCQIYDFIRFDDNSKNRKYGLLEMTSGGCNRDGLALRYVIQNLLQREEERKLLILISDGRPNSQNYSGRAAEVDLSEAKKEFERKGGRLIAAAIGDDKDIIKRIYQDSFLDISEISQLPLKMIQLITRYLEP